MGCKWFFPEVDVQRKKMEKSFGQEDGILIYKQFVQDNLTQGL